MDKDQESALRFPNMGHLLRYIFSKLYELNSAHIIGRY